MGNIDTSRLRTRADIEREALERLTRTFEHAIQSHLDAAARARGYDSIATAVSYAEEPAVARFQEDGRAFRAWRSLVWQHAYSELERVKSGERPVPTVEDFLAELPALDAPS